MVKVDIHKAERPYEQITFSDVTCIKGLIKLRSKLDGFTNASHVSSLNWKKTVGYASDCVSGVNQELIAVYVTLDDYIKKANLNIKQRHIINGLMSGYTEQDLAEEWKTDVRNVASVLDTVANRIKDANDLEWKYNYVYMNVFKANFEYKKCSKCNENKPSTRDFFGKDTRNANGLKSWCKRCEADRRSSAE